MSYLLVTDLIVTRGSAAWHWRQDLLRSIGRSILHSPLVKEDLDDLWNAVWKANGRRDYQRPKTQ
jgi:hypothetical protein